VAADQSARQHAISGDPDAKLPASGQDLVLDASRDQRILDLQIADRMNFMRPANGVGADLGKPDMADVSCLHHLGDGADCLLDGDVGIKPGRAIDIDIVGAEAAEGISEEGLHCRRPRVIAEPISGDVAQRAELDTDHDGRAVAALSASLISISLWPIP